MCSQEVGLFIQTSLTLGQLYFACFKFQMEIYMIIGVLGESLVRSIKLLGLKVIRE
jgi:hypothetical protein